MEKAPEGFAPTSFQSRFVADLGPYYLRRTDDQTIVGVFAQEKHCNASGFIHGGFLMTLADLALTRGSAAPDDNLPRITLGLTADFERAGRCGDWLEARVTTGKSGRTLVFAECHIWAGDQLLLRASGILRPVDPPSN